MTTFHFYTIPLNPYKQNTMPSFATKAITSISATDAFISAKPISLKDIFCNDDSLMATEVLRVSI